VIYSIASPALSSAVGTAIGVGFIERMTPLAMGLSKITRSSAFPPDSTANVFKSGHGLKMRWVNAATHPAEMIKFEPIWDRTSVESPGYSMCLEHPFPASSSLNRPVTLSLMGTSPKPTPSVRFRTDLSFESFAQPHDLEIA
jgi:hypothetical protein